MTASNAKVVIAGMGPVGMTAALALGRAGLDVLVLEAGADLADESRASTFHPPTLEILDDLGVGEALHATGIKAPVFQYRDRAHGVLAELDLTLLADETRFPYRLQSEQFNLTRIIREELSKYPNVELRFEAPVARVERGSDYANVYVQRGDGEELIRAEWLIGADGANSIVRRSLGIAFDGITYPVRYLVVSTEEEFTELIPGLALVSYVSDPEEWLVLLRTPRHWRVLFPVAEDMPDDVVLDPDRIEAALQKVVQKDTPYRVAHTTLYRVHQRVAAEFALGRILLAGDAAHINNPLGGMGMNSGIHDALAAARSIIAAYEGADPEACAANYGAVRHRMAQEFVQADTHRNYKALQARDESERDARRRELEELGADVEAARTTMRRSSMIGPYAEGERAFLAGLRAAQKGGTPGDGGQAVRALLNAGRLVLAPGCFDPISARLAESAGFDCVYLSGATASAVVLGEQDLGFAGLSDVLEMATRVASATTLPIISDADAGYGGPLQVAHTVRRFEQLGIGAIHLEDQVFPKRAASDGVREVIDPDTMVGLLDAAVAASRSIVIIARTDAYGREGIEGVTERARRYAEVGVDAIFAEGVCTRDELEQLHRAVPNLPLVVNCPQPTVPEHWPSLEELEAVGVRLVIFPMAAVVAATAAVHDTFAAIKTQRVNGLGVLDPTHLHRALGAVAPARAT